MRYHVRKAPALALAALLLSGCGQAPAPPEAPPLLREDPLPVGETAGTLRRFGAAVSWEEQPVLDRVEVRWDGHVQTFDGFQGDGAPPLDGELRAEDLNFDGWTDFRIFSGSYRGNEGWHCWLWDPEAGAFAYDAALSGLRNPVWVPEEGCIYTAAYAGLGGAALAVYGWEDGAPVCLRSFDQVIRYLDPPFGVEASYSVRRDGELREAWSWRGDAPGPDDALLPPEAEAYLKLVTPPVDE